MSPWATSTRLTEDQRAGGGMSVSRETFDYVIVGAGSAGCVLADRLTEDGRDRVLVLEYGGSDRSLWIQMPTALYIPMNMARYDWRYYTEPEPHLGGRRLHTPRGKVLGGSSSINGLVYVRGNPLDFESWEAEGAAGWGYRDVLPYFKRAERRAGGGDEYRGAEGPLATRRGTLENPLNAAWLEAGRQAGYALTADMNGFQQEGLGEMDMTVGGGRRCSAANAYLRPAMSRPNLTVRTHALATRVLFDGRRAAGIRYERGGGSHEVLAQREVLLCAGPINTPQLLKLSGVGPAREVRRAPRAAQDLLQLHVAACGLGGDARLRAHHARDVCAARVRSLPRARDPAGRGRRDRRADRCLHSREGRERLPPLRHLEDGKPRRPSSGGRPRNAPDRARGAQGGRLIDHAVDHHRQSQRADHHARGEGGGPHSRQAAAAALDGALLHRAELAERAALELVAERSSQHPRPQRRLRDDELIGADEHAGVRIAQVLAIHVQVPGILRESVCWL